MKIIVTGGLGHIGSRLIREIANKYISPEIIIIDNLLSSRYISMFNLPNSASYKLVEEDVRLCNINQLLIDADFLIHLAAATDPSASLVNPNQYEDNNFQSTKKVALACLAMNVPLIMISSTSIYGSIDETVSEDTDVSEDTAQSPYAKIKLKEERLVKDLIVDGLRFTILRFGTIFGTSPGMRFHTAVNKFCWQATHQQKISVWRTAFRQTRPYLHIMDAIDAIFIIIDKNEFSGEIYNVVSQNSTVEEVINMLKIDIKNIKIDYIENGLMNNLSYTVDCTKIRKLGLNITRTLDQGIAEMIKILKHKGMKDESM